MCVLSKFDYAKFGVYNLLFSKVIEERTFVGVGGGAARHLLVKEGLKKKSISSLKFVN